MDSEWPQDYSAIMVTCWATDPLERMTFSQVLQLMKSPTPSIDDIPGTVESAGEGEGAGAGVGVSVGAGVGSAV